MELGLCCHTHTVRPRVLETGSFWPASQFKTEYDDGDDSTCVVAIEDGPLHNDFDVKYSFESTHEEYPNVLGVRRMQEIETLSGVTVTDEVASGVTDEIARRCVCVCVCVCVWLIWTPAIFTASELPQVSYIAHERCPIASES